jgi:NADPH:quinone reductase-like Zn-dependent oxidoreductase
MKGYVLQGKGDAAWQEVPVPEIGPYDALVRPTAVATCTTDVHAIATMAFPNALGKVIGHEAVGVVSVQTLGKEARALDEAVPRPSFEAIAIKGPRRAGRQPPARRSERGHPPRRAGPQS